MSGRRDRYTVELTWAQVEALRYAAQAALYGSAPASNTNALRHAYWNKLKPLQYRPSRAKLRAMAR